MRTQNSVFWLKHLLVTTQRLFGSTTNTQMAEILLLLILVIFAWSLVLIPGDQTGDGLRGIFRWWLRRD